MYRCLGFLLVIGVVFAKHESYDGHSVYEVTVNSVKQLDFLRTLEAPLHLDVWSHPAPNRPSEILVSKNVKEEFEIKLKLAGIKYKKIVENVKELLDLEDKLMADASTRTASNRSSRGLPFDRTYTWEQIDAYIDILAEDNPGLVTVVNAGNTIEGRPVKYLKISTTNFENTRKPIVYMQSLLHAREWVTQAATLMAIEKLIHTPNSDDAYLLDNIDWIIVPVANPDGFVETHEGNRFWRKNRATGYMAADLCLGVDLNRNFDFLWGTASSSVVCLDTFHGSSGFSEPETIIIRDIILEHKDRIELFFDIHSFGSWLLYGYGDGTLPTNALTLHLTAIQMAEKIDSLKIDTNPNYIVGNVALVLYEASGSAMDYAMSVGIPYTYTYELPGYRGAGQSVFGFLVDPAFIEQAGYETWEGIKVGAWNAISTYRSRRNA